MSNSDKAYRQRLSDDIRRLLPRLYMGDFDTDELEEMASILEAAMGRVKRQDTKADDDGKAVAGDAP